MKQISTTTAILLAINTFGDSPFSIYDITRAIRKNVKDGEYELRYEFDNVEHDYIKDYFTELLDAGLLDHYYARNNPLGYREFCKTIPNTNTPVAPTSPTPTAVVQAAMATTNIPVDVQKKIYSYLKNNGQVTTKMIQSRLKGHPYTCKDIYEFLDKINLIHPNSKNFPDSAKFTVAI
jgi:hypothetical protein